MVARAASLGRTEVEPTLGELLPALERRLAEPVPEMLAALRERDALLDRPVHWAEGSGTGAGIDGDGNLLVRTAGGAIVALRSGEVHLGTSPGMPEP